MADENAREARKSWVRVIVTYIAATFLFGGGVIFIGILLYMDKSQEALTLFQTLTPVSAAIVSYWFAGRGKASTNSDNSNKG